MKHSSQSSVRQVTYSPQRTHHHHYHPATANSTLLLPQAAQGDQSYSQIIGDKVSALLAQAKAAATTEDDNGQVAIACLQKALFLKPNLSDIYLELADVYQSINDTTAALTYLKHANSLQFKPATESKIKDLLFQRGFLMLQQGEQCKILQNTPYDEAFQSYLRFDLASFPKQPAPAPTPSAEERFSQQSSQSTANEQLQQVAVGSSTTTAAAAWTHYLRAYCYTLTYHKSYALEELELAFKKEPNWIDLHLLKGKILWSQNLHPDGNKCFWRAEQLNCTHGEVVEFLKLIIPKADVLLKDTRYLLVQNDFAHCLTNVTQGLNLFPNNTQFLLIKAFILRKQKSYEESLRTLKLAYETLRDKSLEFEIKSQFALTYNEMGLLCLEQNQSEEAMALLDEALLYKPTDPTVLISRGDCLRAQNRYDDALKDYLKAQKYSASETPHELTLRISMMRNSRGIILFNQKKYEKALKEFNEAIKLTENVAQYFYHRAKCHLVLKSTQSAVADFLRCNALDPTNLEVATIIAKFKQDSKGKQTIANLKSSSSQS